MVIDPARQLARIDAAVVAMERTGVHIDVGLCNSIGGQAAIDELDAWERLRPWANWSRWGAADLLGVPELIRSAGASDGSADSEVHGDPGDGDEDGAALSEGRAGESGAKLKQYLHAPTGDGGLALEPSPFWKKGAVKPGELKTDATALEYLAGHNPEHRPMLLELLRLRRARSCLKYLRKLPLFVLPGSGRVHPVYGPSSDSDERVGAITGRFAVKKPELQQIPRDPRKDIYGIRRVFTAPAGYEMVGVDYAALEVVILAHLIARLFGDHSLADAVRRGAPDVHGVHALAVFRDVLGHDYLRGVQAHEVKKHDDPRVQLCRELIKAVFYGLGYGKTEWGFGSTLFMADGSPLGQERARAMIDALFAFRPGIPRYQEAVAELIIRDGGISSLGGRWCDLGFLLGEAKNDRRSRGNIREAWAFKKAHKRATNFPCQGGGADIIGEAMSTCNEDPRIAKLGAQMALQNHDELLFYVPEGRGKELLPIVIENMEGAWPSLLSQLQAAGKVAGDWAGLK